MTLCPTMMHHHTKFICFKRKLSSSDDTFWTKLGTLTDRQGDSSIPAFVTGVCVGNHFNKLET